MRLTVLADNNTYIDKYYLGEPALSYFIEDGDETILFDCGYSDVFLRNAERIGLDISKVNTVVLSHGHDDHTGGLPHLIRALPHARLVSHPGTLAEKQYNDGRNAGSILRETDIPYEMSLSKEPQKISEHITFLGEIPQTNDFEERVLFGVRDTGGQFEPDYVMEDSALVYETE
ncbi:MAG TPA: MBL fold metallo-hydrolase [Methanocorpusculum sp.]|nr:MBL fold metallo-hydrolase [Methanocorpusculum sp.]